MTLKKTIYIVVAFLGMNLVCSCSDWLDYTPKDQQTEDQQFSNREGFYGAVNGVYNKLMSTSLYGKNMTYGALDFMGKRYNTGETATRTETKWAQYNYTDESIASYISSTWSTAYSIILNVNVILDNLEKKKSILTDRDYNVMKGDLLALRAFLHLDMLRLFGPVYSKDSQTPTIPYNNTREGKAHDLLSSKDLIYNHLIPDLAEAEKLLKAFDPILTEGVLATDSSDGDNYLRYRQLRMNYFAAILLKARAYLWAGDKTNAAIEARKITDNTQVKTIFPFVNSGKLLGNTVDPDRVFSTEILFGCHTSNRSDAYTSLFDNSNLSASVLLQPRASYLNLLFAGNTGDYRYISQWSTVGAMSTFTKYKEITVDEKNPPFYKYLMPLIHLSEAYYIAAEALATVDAGAAMGYINTILKARGATLLENANNTKIVDEVKLEYMRETCGEGQIFYMLKRFNQQLTGVYNAENTAQADPNYVLPLPANEQENR